MYCYGRSTVLVACDNGPVSPDNPSGTSTVRTSCTGTATGNDQGKLCDMNATTDSPVGMGTCQDSAGDELSDLSETACLALGNATWQPQQDDRPGDTCWEGCEETFKPCELNATDNTCPAGCKATGKACDKDPETDGSDECWPGCTLFGENLYSASGTRCTACEEGKQPNGVRERIPIHPNGTFVRPVQQIYTSWALDDGEGVLRTECVACAPGEYSVAGICRRCEDIAATDKNSFISGAGASRCTSCAAGKQPDATRTACEDCPDGEFSPYGVCKKCPNGTQPIPSRAVCVSCETVGAMYHSLDGKTCERCPDGKQPLNPPTDCESCAGGELGTGGECFDACVALGCSNQTLPMRVGAELYQIDSIDELCTEATEWVASGAGTAVSVGSGGNCNNTACDMQASEGLMDVEITGTQSDGVDTRTAVCRVQLDVRAARIEVEPRESSVACLSTTYTDATVNVTNTGGQPATVFNVDIAPDSVDLDADSVDLDVSLAAHTRLPSGQSNSPRRHRPWLLSSHGPRYNGSPMTSASA